MYFFRLRAIDANGEEGEFSETVSATPEGAGGVISPIFHSSHSKHKLAMER